MVKSIFYIINFGILLSFSSLFGQSVKWNNINKADYSIKYPTNWTIDKSGLMGTNLILFSELKTSEDQFKENVNLIIQDLTEHSIELNQYVELSENQIKSFITNCNIISSKRIKKEEDEYHQLIYTGTQGVFNLKFEQHYWIKNNKAFILTLTTESSQYQQYKDISTKILNSFKIN